MKKVFLVLFLSLGIKLSFSQCDFCGTYKGNNKQRWHELIIKKDSTFEYTYTDKWASLMGSDTKGKWKVIGNKIELNSEFDDNNYEVISKKIDLCENSPRYLVDNCKKLIKIQVVNLKNEYIWHLKSVMINKDTTKVSSILIEDLNNYSSSESSAYFISETVNQINIYNGFYSEFEIKIDDPSVNYIKIKGNFADKPWYSYFIRQKWKIRKNKLSQNKKFGNFIKIK